MNERSSNVTISLSDRRRMVFLYAVLVLYAAFAASSYGINVAMPGRMLEMEAMDFYALASAMGTLGMMLTLPLVGKMCSIFGIRKVALFGVALQLVTRITMIHCNILPLFLILYAVSNIGTGLYLSAPFAMIAEVTLPGERPKYYGMLVTFKALGSLLGPLVTGWLMDSGYGSLSFISYLPFLLLSVPFIMVLYPDRKVGSTDGSTESVKFDFAGIFLFVVSITSIIFYLSLGGKSFGWLSSIGIILLTVGVIGLVMLVRVESKHASPTVAIGMFRKKRFTNAFLSSMFISSFSTVFGAYVIVYTQQVMQVSSTISSTGTMPMTIAQAVFGLVFGRILAKEFAKRFRPVALLALTLIVLGMVLICTLQPDSSMLVIYAASALGGIGTVIPQSAYASFFQTELRPEEIGAAQGMFSFGGTGGSCIFMAVSGAMTNGGASISHIFFLAAVWCVVSLLIGIIGFRIPQEEVKQVL